MHRLNLFLSWSAPRSGRALFFGPLQVLTLTLDLYVSIYLFIYTNQLGLASTYHLTYIHCRTSTVQIDSISCWKRPNSTAIRYGDVPSYVCPSTRCEV